MASDDGVVVVVVCTSTGQVDRLHTVWTSVCQEDKILSQFTQLPAQCADPAVRAGAKTPKRRPESIFIFFIWMLDLDVSSKPVDI